jgi:hypothetical protein
MSNGSNFVYVAPDVAPSETFSESFGKIGERMRQAGVANQQARQEAQRLAAQNQRSLMAQRNTQYNALLNVGKDTENFSMADLEEINDLKMQSLEKFEENPDLFKNLLTNLTTHYNMGKKHAQLKEGATSAADEYIALLGNVRDFRGPEGMMPILSAEDFQTKNKSYDQMGEKTGERFTDPTTQLEMDIFNYYTPGSVTTYDASFRQKHSGAEIQRVQEQNGTVKLVAMQNGTPIDEQVVSGPLIFYPARGNGQFFNPQTINVERASPEDLLSGRGKTLAGAVNNLRGMVQARDIKPEEARARLAERINGLFQSPVTGQGVRASALDMWNDAYGEDYGDIPMEEAINTYGLPSPQEMYTKTFLDIANVSYKEPAARSGSTRVSKFDRDSYTVNTGLPDDFVSDQNDEKRGVLYQNIDQELQEYGTNTQELLESKRSHIFVPGQKIFLNDRKYDTLEVYFDQNIVLMEKSDNFDGKPSSRTTANRWTEDRLNERYWDRLPEKKYDVVRIYNEDGKTLTDEFGDLAKAFKYAYGNDPQVSDETLLQVIEEKFD